MKMADNSTTTVKTDAILSFIIKIQEKDPRILLQPARKDSQAGLKMLHGKIKIRSKR
jgi:hypothetical protein